jgi:hypothetical protein
MGRPPHRSHDPPHRMLGRLVLRGSRAIQIPSPAADQYKASILLLIRLRLSVLADEVVSSQFSRVERSVKIDIDRFQIRLLRSRCAVSEDVVWSENTCVGDDVMDLTGGGE